MIPGLPPDISPSGPPSPERLAQLTDDELYAAVAWWRHENYAVVGMQFWLDELATRRTERQLQVLAALTERMESAAAREALETARMAELVEQSSTNEAVMVRLLELSGQQTTTMLDATERIRGMTKAIVVLTAVNVIAAVAAAMVSAVALTRA